MPGTGITTLFTDFTGALLSMFVFFGLEHTICVFFGEAVSINNHDLIPHHQDKKYEQNVKETSCIDKQRLLPPKNQWERNRSNKRSIIEDAQIFKG